MAKTTNISLFCVHERVRRTSTEGEERVVTTTGPTANGSTFWIIHKGEPEWFKGD